MMRNGNTVNISLILVSAFVFWSPIKADVEHWKSGSLNQITYVSNSDWQPENFDNGTAVPATHMIDAGITLDGKENEIQWRNAAEVKVPLSFGDVREVSLKALYTDKEIFLLVRWPDATQNRDHRPWTWDTDQERYVEGSQIEDSVLLSFEAGCEWTPSLLSGYTYDFDGWHWLAARSDPLNQALDLYGNVQKKRLNHASFGAHEARNLEDQWQLKFTQNSKPDLDAGWDDLDRLYMKRPVTKTLMYIQAVPDGGYLSPPYFELLPPPTNAPSDEELTYPQFNPVKLTGSAGEVGAKGHWENGFWTVEFRRDRSTPVQHIYDTIFNRLVQFSVHVFDHTDQLDEVSESGRLFLQFLPQKLILVEE